MNSRRLKKQPLSQSLQPATTCRIFTSTATETKRRVFNTVILAAFSAGLAGSITQAGATPPTRDSTEQWAKGRILVMPRAGLPDLAFQKAMTLHGGKSAKKVGKTNFYLMELDEGVSEQATVEALARHPHIKFAELDKRVAFGAITNDPSLGSEWHLSKIEAPTAWDMATGAGLTVAILDTGIDGTHPDLAAQMVPGWNFYDNNSDTADVHGHGTATAGTAAAAGNNGIGVAGVAYGAKIMPLRISDLTGYANFSTAANALTWAADHGAKVANISYGVSGSLAVQNAAQYLRNKGGVTVVSAGNNNRDEGFATNGSLISVSATDSNDARAGWSSYGAFVDVTAPGVGILSTNRGGGYGSWSGTSFSSPITAGMATLIMSANPSLAPSQIENILFSTALDIGTAGKDIYYGYGRINAAAAVQAALNTTASDTQAPGVSISTPTGGTVSGIVPINVDATDNIGVTKVELRANGVTVASDTAPPYQFSWDSTTSTDGVVNLVAVAYDLAGNNAASPSVKVTVANNTQPDTTPPTATITAPANNATVTGVTQITAKATDDSGTASLTQSIYVDNVLKCMGNGGTLSCNWNTKKEAKGAHTIKAIAKDAAGNTTSTSIQVFK